MLGTFLPCPLPAFLPFLLPSPPLEAGRALVAGGEGVCACVRVCVCVGGGVLSWRAHGHNLVGWLKGSCGDTDVGGGAVGDKGVTGPRQCRYLRSCAVTCSAWILESQSGHLASFFPSNILLPCDNGPDPPSFWTSVSVSGKERGCTGCSKGLLNTPLGIADGMK